jgi:hypothetical protein
MNTKKSIYLSLAAALLLGSCSPDEYSLSKPDLTAEELVQGVAYTVDVDAQNTITLTSLLDKSYNCYWVHPNGRAQGNVATLALPFAGTYEVTFGVDTRGGVVYGAPYQFTINTNNMSLLEDPLYTYLTGGVGKSKKWVPVDRDYGVGNCTGPVMYANPDDVLNDGSASTDIGINHMVPNWDPGFQSWLIPQDSPYMKSSMTFSLDDKQGCTVSVYRAEEDKTYNGKWNLLVEDKNHPTLSFTDAFALHNVGFDEVCANYTDKIVITALTPYFLQLATMRTNSEGPWWIVWNYIAEDVQQGKVQIPSDEAEYLNPTAPVLPEIEDLETKLFTTDINGVEFQGAEMTFQVSQDAAYDWMWWNGATSAWESVVKGNYGTSWAPMWDEDAVAESELTLTRKGDYTYGEYSGKYTIQDSKIVFDQPVTFFTVTGDQRTVMVTGSEWQVFKVDPGSELIIGVPDGKDANGATNAYLVAGFTYKAVGGGQTGPVNVPFIAENANNYIEAGQYFRCQIYNPWGGGGDAVDPANIKLKKNQKLNVTLRLSGFTFSQPAKMVLCCNRGDEQNWEPDCFNYARAITVNGDGTYTISWTNDTGSTVKWDDATSALTMTMQYVGYATLADESDAGLKAACAIESITIE